MLPDLAMANGQGMWLGLVRGNPVLHWKYSPNLCQGLLMTTFKQRINNEERRSGKDRRQQDGCSPTGHERRGNVEQRKPDVEEITLSQDEWEELVRGNAINTPPR